MTANRKDYESKLEKYRLQLERRDIWLPVYRRFQIAPIAFWHPIATFFFFIFFGQLFLTIFFGVIGLVMHFSIDRLTNFANLLFSWQLLSVVIPLGAFGTIMQIFTKRKYKFGKWEDFL